MPDGPAAGWWKGEGARELGGPVLALAAALEYCCSAEGGGGERLPSNTYMALCGSFGLAIFK